MLKACAAEANNDGYSAINLVFESYFEFQPIIGDKKEKEDHKRTLRLIECELK
jgi:hypothetical protein